MLPGIPGDAARGMHGPGLSWCWRRDGGHREGGCGWCVSPGWVRCLPGVCDCSQRGDANKRICC